MAMSYIFRDDPQGKTVRHRFKEVFGQLSGKYGVPNSADGLRKGSTLTGADNWVKSLAAGEREYHATWDSILTDNIARIHLRACAKSTGETYLILEYDYKNLAAWLQEKASREAAEKKTHPGKSSAPAEKSRTSAPKASPADAL